jgi:hypothetical protein
MQKLHSERARSALSIPLIQNKARKWDKLSKYLKTSGKKYIWNKSEEVKWGQRNSYLKE